MLAHELQHTMQFRARHYEHMKGFGKLDGPSGFEINKKYPISEVDCEHAAARAVRALEDHRFDIEHEIEAITESVKWQEEAKRARQIERRGPESKRTEIEELLGKWQRKAKLAATKIKKLKTRLRYYDKKISMEAGEKMRIAAEPPDGQ